LSEPLRIDPASDPHAATTLEHDLDLTVTVECRWRRDLAGPLWSGDESDRYERRHRTWLGDRDTS
jgi:hypothetical protein